MDKFEKQDNRTAETVTYQKWTDRGKRMQEDRKTSGFSENPGDDREEEIRDADAAENKRETDDEGSMKDDVAAAKKEAAENHDRLLRVCADFENYKKRAQRQMDDHRKYSNTELIKDLLPIIDNLERAVEAQKQSPEGSGACMAEGVEMTLNEIKNVLKKYDVTPVEANGKPFDPNYHEAMMQEDRPDLPENTVVNELQKGYLLHDRLIRPSMVVVSKGGSTNKSE